MTTNNTPDEATTESDTFESETLGSCGCIDYHMADCPTRTSYLATYEDEGDWYDRDDYWNFD